MGTVVGNWRLKAIIILIVLLTTIFYINSFFYNVDIDDEGYIEGWDTKPLEVNQTEEGTDSGDEFIDVLSDVGDYLTFGNIENPYARLFINLFVTVCWFAIGYIIYTFIKEWIPFT